MRATVVIAVKDDDRIYRLLDSLACQDVAKEDFEVIVVENGSKKHADVAVHPTLTIRYFQLEVSNMARARNLGVSRASGLYVLSTDADVVASPQWVGRMLSALETGRYGAVGVAIEKFQPETLVQKHAITICDGQRAVSYLPALDLPYVAGANCGYHSDTIRLVGGFDEDLESGSDVDICYKIGLRGATIGIAPDALVYHEDRAGLSAHFNRFRKYAVYQVLLFKKYKHITRLRYVLNPYPYKRFIGAFGKAPSALANLTKGDAADACQALLQATEAIAIWTGSIQGSIRFRELYV